MPITEENVYREGQILYGETLRHSYKHFNEYILFNKVWIIGNYHFALNKLIWENEKYCTEKSLGILKKNSTHADGSPRS